MLIRRVIDDQLDQDFDLSRVRRFDERAKVVEPPVARMNVPVVRDVVPIVFERRREEGQEPQAGDAEALQIIELLGESRKIADAVLIAVVKRFHMRLVNDRVPVPVRNVLRSRGRRGYWIDG